MNQLADENKTIVDKYDNLNREYVNRIFGELIELKKKLPIS